MRSEMLSLMVILHSSAVDHKSLARASHFLHSRQLKCFRHVVNANKEFYHKLAHTQFTMIQNLEANLHKPAYSELADRHQALKSEASSQTAQGRH